MIVVYSGDRAWRLACERALRVRAVPTRVASRPAELAKALADGAATLVIVGPDTGAAAQASTVITTQQCCNATPGDTIEEIVHRAIALRTA